MSRRALLEYLCALLMVAFCAGFPLALFVLGTNGSAGR